MATITHGSNKDCPAVAAGAKHCPGHEVDSCIWKIYYTRKGGHVTCRLFCGPGPRFTSASCGIFTVREDEFEDLKRVFKAIYISEV